MDTMGLLQFEDAYFERIWGGNKLQTLFNKAIPPKPIGEAWLVSDHPVHESVITNGPLAGQTLREIIQRDSQAVLGARPQLTHSGRFPLLLKILDAAQVLSVQVHPDDACAERLGEPDVGKTEMWHVLQADPGSELICGLDTSVTPDNVRSAIEQNTLENLMNRYPVHEGTSILLPAGTIHAIGAGIVLAEIQQNSDLTYRLYDWGRLDDSGQPRQLHIDKAMEAIQFHFQHNGPATPLDLPHPDAHRTVLAACTYFATELWQVEAAVQRVTDGQTFHILLAIEGNLTASADDGAQAYLAPGQAVLVPGQHEGFTVTGNGRFLDYYVPDLQHDIIAPLLKTGHNPPQIADVCANTIVFT